MKKASVLFFSLFLYCGVSFADCSFDGKTYPEGSVLGPYKCVDDQWVKQ